MDVIAGLGAALQNARNQIQRLAGIAQQAQERSEALSRILEERGIEDPTRPTPKPFHPLSTDLPPGTA